MITTIPFSERLSEHWLLERTNHAQLRNGRELSVADLTLAMKQLIDFSVPLLCYQRNQNCQRGCLSRRVATSPFLSPSGRKSHKKRHRHSLTRDSPSCSMVSTGGSIHKEHMKPGGRIATCVSSSMGTRVCRRRSSLEPNMRCAIWTPNEARSQMMPGEPGSPLTPP